MKTLMVMCLLIAATFTASAQKEAKLIEWLNKESANIVQERTKSAEAIVAAFSVTNDYLVFSGINRVYEVVDMKVNYDQIDAIIYSDYYSQGNYVNIYLKMLTSGKQECLSLYFEKEKQASKYYDKLQELMELKGVARHKFPAYVATMKEITDSMTDNLRLMEKWECSSNLVPAGKGNEVEITEHHIKLFNKTTGKEQTILWANIKDIDDGINRRRIYGSKKIGGEDEYIAFLDIYPLIDELRTMKKTMKGEPATFMF